MGVNELRVVLSVIEYDSNVNALQRINLQNNTVESVLRVFRWIIYNESVLKVSR